MSIEHQRNRHRREPRRPAISRADSPGWLWAALALLVASFPGCGADGPTRDPSDDDCYRSLESYCSAWPCPSFEQSVADVRQFGAHGPGACFEARAGSCGDLRFTSRGGGFGVTKLYFDATGALVAVYETTDVIRMGSACPNWKHYGRRLSCQEIVVDDYCRR